LTFRVEKGDNIPYSSTEYQVETSDFFATHPVFSLDQATSELAPAGGRRGTIERLKHHLEKGRLKLVTRGVYAVVPEGLPVSRYYPDSFLVIAALREDGIISHHGALELLGAAHSAWKEYSVYSGQRRRSLRLDGITIRFLDNPSQVQDKTYRQLGTRRVERQGKLLTVTGPERTLVEGFRWPTLAGGLEELVQSAAGFPVLDLDLLEKVLQRYDIATLWSATGWFLERFQKSFHVSGSVLGRMEAHRPRAPHYLERGSRGGVLASRWNLIIPNTLARNSEPDES
jgi:predicted transcriptional regulator of viral defense system